MSQPRRITVEAHYQAGAGIVASRRSVHDPSAAVSRRFKARTVQSTRVQSAGVQSTGFEHKGPSRAGLTYLNPVTYGWRRTALPELVKI